MLISAVSVIFSQQLLIYRLLHAASYMVLPPGKCSLLVRLWKHGKHDMNYTQSLPGVYPMSVYDVSEVNSTDQWERPVLPLRAQRRIHFISPAALLNCAAAGINGDFGCFWAEPALLWRFVEANGVLRQHGYRLRWFPSQRSGSHARPRWIPQRLPRGLHILGLAYPAAADKHAAAGRRHFALVQRLQIQGPPEEQRQLVRRGGCFAGREVKCL